MSRMTVAWLAIYATFLFGSFVNPLFGTLGYLFEYYLRPALHWWGAPLPDLRWNFTISVVLTLTYALKRRSLPDIGPARRGPGRCLVGLLLVMLLVLPIAANQRLSWAKTVEYSKMILFHGLVVGTVRTELGFDAVVAAHMAGATWWGWEAYTNPKRSAGRLANVGSGDSHGDNDAAAHLLTVIPFIAVYLVLHKDKRLKALAFLAAPLVLNAFILCNSRGAVLAAAVMVAAAFALVRSGHRFRMIAVGVALGVGLYVLADPQFIARQQQTDYSNDGSAQGRLEAWRGALSLIADNPFGTGGQGFWELSPIYASSMVDRLGEKRDPHNTFVLVASEWGILGLTLFLGYYLSVFRLLAEVKRTAKGGIWYYRSIAIQLALIGMFVASMFTDRLYAEAPYWMGALAVALHRLHSYRLRQNVSQEHEAPRAGVSPTLTPAPALSRALKV